jgi:hypothetical protein
MNGAIEQFKEYWRVNEEAGQYPRTPDSVIREMLDVIEKQGKEIEELRGRLDVIQLGKVFKPIKDQPQPAHYSKILPMDLIGEILDTFNWCSGSADFNPGGKAYEGWVEMVVPLIEKLKDLAAHYSKPATKWPEDKKISYVLFRSCGKDGFVIGKSMFRFNPCHAKEIIAWLNQYLAAYAAEGEGKDAS